MKTEESPGDSRVPMAILVRDVLLVGEAAPDDKVLRSDRSSGQ